MKELLIFPPLTLIYLALKSTVFQSVPLPDIPLLFVFYIGFRKASVAGVAAAFALGYMEDALTGGIFGLTSLALVSVFLIVHLMSKRVHFSSPAMRAGGAFALAFAKGLIIYLLMSFIGLKAPFLWRTLLKAAITAAFAPAVILLLMRISSRLNKPGLANTE
jgi:rod shape-determining protein MreD